MKIDFESDIALLNEKIKRSRFLYLCVLGAGIIANILLIIFTDYFNRKAMIFASVGVDLFCSLFIFVCITLYIFRFKRIKNYFQATLKHSEQTIKGQIKEISKEYTHMKELRVCDIVVELGPREFKKLIFLSDLYNYDFEEGKRYTFLFRENVITGVIND